MIEAPNRPMNWFTSSLPLCGVAMKTTRVGGGHPQYKVLADAAAGGGPRATILFA